MPSKRKAEVPATSSRASSSKNRRSSQTQATGEEAAVPLGRSLASTEKRTRDAAIRSLARYLSERAGDDALSPLEVAKLWKGIFYCFWMSDKPLVQQALAQELSDLLLAVPSQARVPAPIVQGFEDSVGDISVRARTGLQMMEGFWDAIIRDWTSLDKWRVDKFYLLIRRFVSASFRLLALESWDANAVAHFSRLLTKPGGPLCANDPKVPDSVTYHFTDVFLDELDKALHWAAVEHNEEQKMGQRGHEDAEEGSKASKKSRAGTTSSTRAGNEDDGPFWALLRPIIDTAATCHSKTIYKKILDNIITPLVQELMLMAIADNQKGPHAVASDSGEVDVDDLDDAQDEVDSQHAADVAYPNIIQSSPLSSLQFRRKVFKLIFDAASRPDALPSNRRKMYNLWQEEKTRREEDGEESSDDEE